MQRRVQSDTSTREINKILVAEDENFQRMQIYDILCLLGYEVVPCEDGLKARDELLKNENDFDLILLDQGLPEMSGLELLKSIKTIEKLKDIPVIMMSGDDQNELIAACLNAGAQDYMVKPVNFKKLQSLATYVKKKPKSSNNNLNEKGTYQLIRNIGKGAFGSVELVRKSTDQQYYAMKVIPTYNMDEFEKKNAENEVSLLRVLTAPTIIKYYESFTENDQLNIIMEYAEGGSLSEKISEYSQSGKNIPKDQILSWMAQLVIAIHFMHSKNILHRDIKTQNMFLSKDQIIKLGDFGISKALGTHVNLAKTFLGTPYFMAPEVIRGEPYGKKADIWALGCALYELVMLKKPFTHDVMQIMFEMIQNKPYEMDPSVDPELQMLIEKTLQKDPNNRPYVQDLANIPCIEEKINSFYKDHPNETNLISSRRFQIGVQTLENAQVTEIQDENYVKLVGKMMENIQLRKVVYGIVNQIEYIAFLGSDVISYLTKTYETKTESELFQIAQESIEQQLVIPLESQKEFIQSCYYSFPLFLPFIAANNYQKYTGNSADLMDILDRVMKKFREFQQLIIDKNQIQNDVLDNSFIHYFQCQHETHELQKAFMNDYSDNQQLAAYINIYKIMRFHQQLNYYYQERLQKNELISEPKSIIKKIIGSILPSHPIKQDFAYSISKLITTIPQLKHGILRRNKPYPNFHSLPKNDSRILKLDIKGIFALFIEEYQDQSSILTQELLFLDEKTVLNYLKTQISQFVKKNVCLDIIEQEIIVHPIFQTYLCDFGSEKQLLEWLLIQMETTYNTQQLLNQYDQQDFYIRFKKPNTQAKQISDLKY